MPLGGTGRRPQGAPVSGTVEFSAADAAGVARLNKRALRQFTLGATSSAAERAPHYGYAASAEHREGLEAFNQNRPPRF